MAETGNNIVQLPALLRYAPKGLLRREHDEDLPRQQANTGSVLIADLCGFTRLATDLTSAGRAGAEQLTALLDHTFGPLIDRVETSGGDVIGFAGDAVIAVFEQEDLSEAALVATACALDHMREHEALEGSIPDHLPLRIAIACGDFERVEVGGERGEYMHLAVGPAVEEVLAADALRETGRIVVTHRTWEQLSRPTARTHGEYHVLEGNLRLTLPRSQERLAVPSHQNAVGIVPRIVKERLENTSEQFIAEFRNVTAVFVTLPAATSLLRLQETAVMMQRELQRFDGLLHQAIYDTNGIMLIGLFGAPSYSHDDDPSRGIHFAFAIMQEAARLGASIKTAVTTDLVYCGDFGGSNRRNYGVVGSAMNRCAALLDRAANGQVLVDTITRRSQRTSHELTALTPIQMKDGDLATPYAINILENSGGNEAIALEPTFVVGRQDIRASLAAYLHVIDEHRSHGLVVLEGDAGIGKTTVLNELAGLAEQRDVLIAQSQGDSVGTRSFSALAALVDLLVDREPEGYREIVTGQERGFLHAVTPTRFPPDPRVESFAPQVRLEKIAAIVSALCSRVTARSPVLWLIEDAHLVDSTSRIVAQSLADSTQGLLVVLAQRPMPASEQPSEKHTHFRLEPMPREDIRAIIANRLAVTEVDERLVDVVQSRAAGNPLFAEELVSMHLERGDITVLSDTARSRVELTDVDQVSAPPSLERLITARMDRLQTGAQLTLRAASVLGTSFARKVLQEVREEPEEAELDHQLQTLADAGLLSRPDEGDNLTFKHPLFREVAYDLLVNTQRRLLHRRAAYALERFDEGNSALIAHHWEKSQSWDRALPHLLKGAESALKSYANVESINLHQRAIKVMENIGMAESDMQLPRIHCSIADAYASLTQQENARDHYHHSLAANGWTIPDGNRGLPKSFARHLRHRLRRRLTGRGAPIAAADELIRTREVMYAMAGLAPVELWLGNPRAFAHLALELSNVGDILEPEKEVYGGAAGLGYLFGLTPLRSLGEKDLKRATAGAAATGDSEMLVLCSVMQGMYLTASGRPDEAITILHAAADMGAKLHGGPWRHRAQFQYGEALLLAGRLEEACSAFDQAAHLARFGEPRVVGFANALGALALCRNGSAEEAFSRLLGTEGLETTRSNDSKLPLFASLGVFVDVSARTDRHQDLALSALREAELLALRSRNTAAYFAGFFGHCGILEWYLRQWESGVQSAKQPTLQALDRLRTFSRRYPAAASRVRLTTARIAALSGRANWAKRLLQTVVAEAERKGLRLDAEDAKAMLDQGFNSPP